MTILVAMHLGSQTVLISDKFVFKEGEVVDEKFMKLHQANNFATVSGGSGEAMIHANNYLKGRTISGQSDLRGMSDDLLQKLYDPFSEYSSDVALMYVSATINNQACLFTVIHDELKSGVRLKQLTDHSAGEILFAIPRTLAGQPGDSFKKEATIIFEAFMAGKGKHLKPHDAHSVAGLAKSIGGVLNKLAKETGAISKNYDMSVINSTGQSYTGVIDVDKYTKVMLMQKRGEKIIAGGMVCEM